MRSLVAAAASQPVRNLSPDPRATRAAEPVVGGEVRLDFTRFPTETNESVVTGATDGPPGTGITSYARRVRKGGGTSSGRGFSLTSGNISDANLALDAGSPCTPGEVLTFISYVRVSTTAVTWRFFIRFGLAGSTEWQSTNTTSAQSSATPGQWLRLTGQFVVPAGVDRFAAIEGMGVVNQVSGEVIESTGLMYVRGKYSGVYCDGNAPGWKWDGPVGASSSVGYPYTLGRIVGAPLVLLETAANVAVERANDVMAGYSHYHVYDAIANTTGAGGASAGATIGPSTTHNPISVAGSSELRTQWGTSQVTNYWRGLAVRETPVGRTIGRHGISAVVTPDANPATATGRLVVDGVEVWVSPSTAHSGMTISRADLADPNARTTPLALIAFDRPHTVDEQAAVHRYLALRYGYAAA